MDKDNPIRLMLITSTTLLMLSIIFLMYACAEMKPVTLNGEIKRWSRQFDLDQLLVTSIIFQETGNGRWFSRNDYQALHTQRWAVEAVKKHKLNPSDGRTWYSIGHMQILLITAKELGYNGEAGSEKLGTGLYNISTNLKYGCMYLADKRNFYTGITDKATWHAVAAYNAGKARTVNGKYLNYEYVDKVRGKFYQLGGRE